MLHMTVILIASYIPLIFCYSGSSLVYEDAYWGEECERRHNVDSQVIQVINSHVSIISCS